MQRKTYLRDRRSAASIECALGTVAMISASLLALNLYRLASVRPTSMDAAFILADTISREEHDLLERKRTAIPGAVSAHYIVPARCNRPVCDLAEELNAI